jgi:NTE family protein
VDPAFVSSEQAAMPVHARTSPMLTARTTPPPPLDALFSGGKSLALIDRDGKSVILRNADEYRAYIKSQRAAAGASRLDDEPIPVQLVLEGGGGKGKRYGATLNEMVGLGVVPTSVTGVSAGAIGASFVAAGGTPAALQRLSADPELSRLFDVGGSAGLLRGRAAFDFIDRKLRELTGIKDRPVTFADLKLPLQIVATVAADSDPPAGKTDLSHTKNRIFVFSQETTPNTPVALAVRASMAIPGVFDPVTMVDPTIGRTVQLIDGGVLDNLPMGYAQNDLPVVGVSLAERGSNHPQADANRATVKRAAAGALDVSSMLATARSGLHLLDAGAADADDFRDRTDPRPGSFMLSVPTWDLESPRLENSMLGFSWDADVDPKLDKQTHAVTSAFFAKHLKKLTIKGARATNTPAKLPEPLHFTVRLNVDGVMYTGNYSGGSNIPFTGPRGDLRVLRIDQQELEAMYLDHMAFGDLGARLADVLSDRKRWIHGPGQR